jgi:hypothetical protein
MFFCKKIIYKYQYESFCFTPLFIGIFFEKVVIIMDFSAPQQTFAPRPPAPWKKNKQFKGHKFSKLAKYGNKKGPRGPF